ncbi:hypothetical protein [Salinibacterium sp. ZJ450]|uniref:hypothetical protein n=1 Tax=Salinibacterium sp. ZJ450 TaxID=2708338 RepID=UPI001421BC93|nr:hypothetical protein [Salinibacterium sp. ZJ450]
MASFIGQIPEEVDALATDFDAKAGDIDTLISALSSKLGSTTWVGSDRTRFEGDWNSTLTTSLRNVAGSLRDAAVLARGNAQQQRDASA